MIIFRGRNARFCLDFETALLRQGEKRIDLPGRQYELLKYLTERPEKLVSWDQLRKDVWRGDNVNDEAISRTLYKLRQALGEEHPTIIETKRRYGVRFIGVIEQPSACDAEANLTTTAERNTPNLRTRPDHPMPSIENESTPARDTTDVVETGRPESKLASKELLDLRVHRPRTK